MKRADLSMFKSKMLGSVHWDGCTMTYHQLGHIKVITCRKGRVAWDVASSLADDTDKIWQDIKAEAEAER